MDFLLSEKQQAAQLAYRAFVEKEVIPQAQRLDSEERIPPELIEKMAVEGFFGAIVPGKYGGTALDAITLGLLHEEFGKGFGSVENMLTVYGMVLKPLLRVGNKEQKEQWVPRIVSGETVPAIAITEPNIGSDIKHIETAAAPSKDGNYYILNGKKKWITLGQVAHLFLIITKCEGRGAAFLVERDTDGLNITPTSGMMGLRANMLVELDLKDCRVPKENLLGRVGTGFTHAIGFALDEGRYTTACGCIGLAQACLEAAVTYAKTREQFGAPLKDHQLVQKMITEMIVRVQAARLLCQRAGYLKETADPSSVTETLAAKYFASKTAVMVSGHALQIHGALGCSKELQVERFYRDAKIMEIIEGASQMYEIQIAKTSALQRR